MASNGLIMTASHMFLEEMHREDRSFPLCNARMGGEMLLPHDAPVPPFLDFWEMFQACFPYTELTSSWVKNVYVAERCTVTEVCYCSEEISVQERSFVCNNPCTKTFLVCHFLKKKFVLGVSSQELKMATKAETAQAANHVVFAPTFPPLTESSSQQKEYVFPICCNSHQIHQWELQ